MIPKPSKKEKRFNNNYCEYVILYNFEEWTKWI